MNDIYAGCLWLHHDRIFRVRNRVLFLGIFFMSGEMVLRETIAKRIYEDGRKIFEENGLGPFPSWDKIGESDREGNRRIADGVMREVRKIYAGGGEL